MPAATNPSSPARGARIRVGVPGDTDAVARLINTAFIVERVVIDGDRTNPENVHALMNCGRFLLAEDATGLVGCVYIERPGEHSYLGLLSVAPQFQGRRLGRQLVVLRKTTRAKSVVSPSTCVSSARAQSSCPSIAAWATSRMARLRFLPMCRPKCLLISSS